MGPGPQSVQVLCSSEPWRRSGAVRIAGPSPQRAGRAGRGEGTGLCLTALHGVWQAGLTGDRVERAAESPRLWGQFGSLCLGLQNPARVGGPGFFTCPGPPTLLACRPAPEPLMAGTSHPTRHRPQLTPIFPCM